MSILNVIVDELPESDVIPAGQYPLRVDEVSDVAEDKNGTEYVKVTFSVTDGEYANRKLFEGYVPLAGSAKLRKILAAAGFEGKKLTSTDDLVGLEVAAIVKVTKSDEYGEQNRIVTYLPLERVVSKSRGKK